MVPLGTVKADRGTSCVYHRLAQGILCPGVGDTQGIANVKVVLFCGGQGLRLREASEHLPKPMVTVGYRPILWHVMRYYAHFGHTEFILCLGYKADVIKNYFLHYEEALSNDFVLSGESGQVELLQRDIADWRITFVDTGLNANVGQRLRGRPQLRRRRAVPGELRRRA